MSNFAQTLIARVRRWREERMREHHARTGGFFWLPCPICGEPFGGNEVMHLEQIVTLRTGVGQGQLVCPKAECRAETTLRNARDWPDEKYFPWLSSSPTRRRVDIDDERGDGHPFNG